MKQPQSHIECQGCPSRYTLMTFILCFCIPFALGAQCLTGTQAGNIIPQAVYQTQSIAAGSPHYYTFSANAGNTYVFTFCSNGGSYTGDTYLTLSDNTPTALQVNDDFCLTGSQITWNCVANGTYRIYISGCCPCANAPASVMAYSCLTCPLPPPPVITGFSPQAACSITDTVIITGSDLTFTTSVEFGGIAAQYFSVLSPTQVVAVPSAGATGAISISTPSGTAVSANTFTVYPSPPAPSPVTATPSNWCGVAGLTQLNAVSPGNTVNWYTVANAGVSLGSVPSGVNFPVTPPNTLWYYAESENASGCTSVSRTAVLLTVANLQLNITQNPPNPGCTPPVLTANLTGVVIAPATGAKYYIRNTEPWNVPNYVVAMDAVFGSGGWTTLTFAAPAASVFNAATQFVYLEGSDGNEAALNNYLLTNAALIESWVFAGGRLLLNRAPNGAPLTQNFGFGGVVNTYTNGVPMVTITAGHPVGSGPFNPSGFSYAGNAYAHALLSGPGLLAISFNNNSIVLAEKNWGSGLGLFGGYTSPSFHSPQPNAQHVFQNWIHYTASSAQPLATSYLWAPGGDTTASITPTLSGVYTVTVTQAGCSVTATTTVVLNAPLFANAVVLGAGVTVSGSGGTPPYLYSINGGPYGPNNTFNNLCSGNYTLSVQDNFGPGCTADTIVNIQNLIDTTLQVVACDSYFFNGNYQTLTGLYHDTLVNAFGCDSFIHLNLQINTVNAAVVLNGNTLSAVATGAVYQWIDCNTNTIIAGATGQNYTPAVSGSYAVIVTQNGCTDTSICRNVTISGIEEQDLATLINVYPNPVNDQFYIEVPPTLLKRTCSIADVSGQIISRFELIETKTTIPFRNYSRGLYTIRMDGSNWQMKIEK